MSISLRQVLKSFIAFIAMLAFLQPCLCEPCGLTAQASTIGAHSPEASLSTGCCPSSDSEESDESAHDCAHCDVDATLVADIQFSLDDGAPLFTPPLAFLPLAIPSAYIAWTPPVEPVAIRRANPPPQPLLSSPNSARLAQLSVWRC